MKKIIILCFLTLIANIIFSLMWCYCLERNLIQLQKQVNNYQEMSFNRDEVQDRELRLLQADIVLLQEGWE